MDVAHMTYSMTTAREDVEFSHTKIIRDVGGRPLGETIAIVHPVDGPPPCHPFSRFFELTRRRPVIIKRINARYDLYVYRFRLPKPASE